MAWLSRTDVEQAVDLVLDRIKTGTLNTANKWDDKVASWFIAGRDGLVNMICKMFGVEDPPVVMLPMHAASEAAIKDTSGIDTTGMSDGIKKVIQFLLQMLSKYFGPFVPVPTPTN
jgi:hypothetical protein